MSNYATDISQNYILNCYIYLHHNEIPTPQLSTAQLLSQHQHTGERQEAILHFTGLPCENLNWQSSKAEPLGAGAAKCKLGLFIPEHMWLVIVGRGGFYCSTLQKCLPFFFFFSPLLCYCSLKCMNVAGWCCVGCACKLQYNITPEMQCFYLLSSIYFVFSFPS